MIRKNFFNLALLTLPKYFGEEQALLNFFEGRAKYPTFKKRHDDQSAEYSTSAFKWDGTSLT